MSVVTRAGRPAEREIDLPEFLFAELMDAITGAISTAPRTLQRRIGPSEIGTPCTRRLIHKLEGTVEVDQASKWRAQVGTAVHAWLDRVISANPLGRAGRWVTETRVTVGEIAGQPISGSCDLFDTETGVVVDWKCVGPNRLKQYRSKGPGQQYRTQAHLYGRGFEKQGHAVTYVAIVFLPRDGELGDAFVWSELYDPGVALAALERATGLRQLVSLVGLEEALKLYPPCVDPWCPWCPVRRPFNAGKKPVTAIPPSDDPFARSY